MRLQSHMPKAVRALALSAVAATVLAGSAMAATVDYTFSFTNVHNGGGTVTGIIRGLQDVGVSAATSVEVLTNTLGFGIGEYVGNPAENSFTVLAGSLINSVFFSFGSNNTAPAVTGGSLLLGFTSVAGLTNLPDSISYGEVGSLTYTLVEPTSVPLPASAWLLVAALAGIGAASRRRKQLIAA